MPQHIIIKENAEFVACMEVVPDIYEMPHDPAVPVVYMDEKPRQMLNEAREPLSPRPGDTQKINSEYIRKGTCSIFVFVEPLGGVRQDISISGGTQDSQKTGNSLYPKA